jgi:hypothetical protein
MRDAETLWQQEFVDAIFPVILRVKGEMIDPPCSCFGVEVAKCSDLYFKNDRGEFRRELMSLVDEVAMTRKAARRNVTVRARGSEEEFCCSICVYYDLHSACTMIGVEIRENWWQHAERMESQKLRSFQL